MIPSKGILVNTVKNNDFMIFYIYLGGYVLCNLSGIQMTSRFSVEKSLFFSLPLMFSQVIEVLFNMSDVAVVGKFADLQLWGRLDLLLFLSLYLPVL